MVEKFQQVWDKTGREMRVRRVDAREIVEHGGSRTAPKSEEEKEFPAQEATYSEEEAAAHIEKPAKGKKAKA